MPTRLLLLPIALAATFTAFAQTPVIQSVVNSASSQPRLAPGLRAVAIGSNLGPAVAVSCPSIATTCSGVSIEIGGRSAFILSVSSGQLQFQIPVELPPGPAGLIVNNQGRQSAPFALQLNTHAPAIFNGTGIFTDGSAGVANAIHNDGTIRFVTPLNPANVDELIVFYAAGLGPTNPVVPSGSLPPFTPPLASTVTLPVVRLGGRQCEVFFSGLTPGFFALYQVTIRIPRGLSPGANALVMEIGGVSSNTATLYVTVRDLVPTQSGFTFQAVPNGSRPSPRSFRLVTELLSPLPFSVTASTLVGGPWLSVTPSSGTIDPAQAAPSISVSVDPSALSAGAYYGQIRIDAPQTPSSPQFLTIVLNVSAPAPTGAPIVEPTGLVFVFVTGQQAPAAQSSRITNVTGRPVDFTVTPAVVGDRNWFTADPLRGSLAIGQTADIRVTPNATGLPTGVYRGSLTIAFGPDVPNRVVDLLLVVTPTQPPTASDNRSISQRQADGDPCPPTRFLPVFTLLGVNFNSPISWPAPIEAVVADDCGVPLRAGSVRASFSNGDPPLELTNQNDGRWSGTWSPGNPRTVQTSVVLTARNADPARPLTGTTQVTGTVPDNPDVPGVNSRGVVSAASYSTTAMPSPGEIISVFGRRLADATDESRQLPLSTQLQGTSLVAGGRALPLVFTSDGQVNAVIPYDLTPGATYQLVARRGNRLSVPEPLAIAIAQPAIFTLDRTGRGQGHVYIFPTATQQFLADVTRPARAGDVMVIYCTGLGPVTPPAQAGAATPQDEPRRVVGGTNVTVGGVPAQVVFAGLTSGFTGLYQVNVVMPQGVRAGLQVPVVVTVEAAPSPPVAIAVQ